MHHAPVSLSRERVPKLVEGQDVIVVPDAARARPPGMDQSSRLRDVGESSVPIVLVYMIGRRLAFVERLQSRAVQYEDIEPAIVIVIEESNSAVVDFDNEAFRSTPP